MLVADTYNNRIRMLSADLQQVSTVAGDSSFYLSLGVWFAVGGHRDGAAAQAQFECPLGLALLPNGCVLVVEAHVNWGRIRVLSADLQQVSTLTNVGVLDRTTGYPDGRLELLPDGRLLVGLAGRPGDKGPVIRVLEGFPAALL